MNGRLWRAPVTSPVAVKHTDSGFPRPANLSSWLYADFATKEWLAQEMKLRNAQNEELLVDLEIRVSEVRAKSA